MGCNDVIFTIRSEFFFTLIVFMREMFAAKFKKMNVLSCRFVRVFLDLF